MRIELTALLFITSCTFARSGSVRTPPTPRYGGGATTESPRASDIVSSPPGPRDETAPTPAGKAPDLDIVGTASKTLLQPNPFERIVVEIDYVQGYEPSPVAADHLLKTLARVTGKRVALRGGNSIPPQGGPYYGSDMVELSKRRNYLTANSVASIWIVYLNGRFALDRTSAGVSFTATGVALFPDRLSESGGDETRAETAVLVHELGHLLGLIDIGLKSPRPREDPHHPGHSSHPGSVMHRTVGSASGSPAPIDFDEDDQMDLVDLRAGRL